MRKLELSANPAKVSGALSVNSIERMTPLASPQMQKETSGVNEPQPAWLISECIAGNEAAIEMFVRQYETGIFRLALSIVGDPAEANEIMQETFIAALRSLSSYEEKKSFKAWLYTIALNLSRSHLRKRKAVERLRNTLTSLFRIETQKQPLPEESAIENDRQAEVWKALNKLDEPFRTVVVLRYFHELSIAEISEILSINEGTIHSRLHKACERLRNSLHALHGE